MTSLRRRDRSPAHNPAPRAPITVPSLSVVFTTAAYPEFQLNEAEDEMIARTAADLLGVPSMAIMQTPAPCYLGQGDREQSMFEVHVREGFANAAQLRGKPGVVSVTLQGPRRTHKMPAPSKALRLPRK